MSNWLIVQFALVSKIFANISVLRMFNFKSWCCKVIWKSIFGTPWTKCADPVATSMTLPIWSSLDPTIRWSSLAYTLRWQWHKGQKLSKLQTQLVQFVHFNLWQSTLTQNVLIHWILHNEGWECFPNEWYIKQYSSTNKLAKLVIRMKLT